MLELDDDNTHALAGLSQLAEHFHEQATRDYEQDRLHDALLAANQGLEALPDHPGLRALRTDIEKEIRKIQHVNMKSENTNGKDAIARLQGVKASVYCHRALICQAVFQLFKP